MCATSQKNARKPFLVKIVIFSYLSFFISSYSSSPLDLFGQGMMQRDEICDGNDGDRITAHKMLCCHGNTPTGGIFGGTNLEDRTKKVAREVWHTVYWDLSFHRNIQVRGITAGGSPQGAASGRWGKQGIRTFFIDYIKSMSHRIDAWPSRPHLQFIWCVLLPTISLIIYRLHVWQWKSTCIMHTYRDAVSGVSHVK